jgi:DNA gyrase subunit B
VLSDVEQIRLRPGLFIGSTGSRGIHRLLWVLVENAVDEFLFGRNKLTEVVINADNSLTVSDTGRGIPIGPVAPSGLPALTVVLTTLAAAVPNSPTIELTEPPDVFGVVVVNALSVWLTAETHRDGTIYRQEFLRGVPTTPVVNAGACERRTGTTISFLPDPEVFDATLWSLPLIEERLRTTAFRTGLRIRLTDERTSSPTEEYGPAD